MNTVGSGQFGQWCCGFAPKFGASIGDVASDHAGRLREVAGYRHVAGLASVLSQHPEFAEAGNRAIVEPWADAHLALMQRAADRGELRSGADVRAASQVVPSMAAYRALIQRKPFDLHFLTCVVDGVLLPALLASDAPPPTIDTHA
jgi:hypothetical protein